jgi:flagellar protein FlgJ
MEVLATPQMPLADAAQSAAMLKAAKNKKAVHEAAQKFEALYMNEMMSYMFQGLETDGPFGGGKGEEVFRSLMIEHYGTKISQSRQTGISETLEKEMLRLQELQQNPNKPIASGDRHVDA